MIKKITTAVFCLVLPLHGLVAQNQVLKIGDKPPKLDLKELGNDITKRPLNWQSLKDRVVVMDFWATWCSPCIKAIPHLNQLSQKFKGKPVTFISITYEPEHMVKPFLEKHKLETIIGLDNDFNTFKSYKAWAIPMIVVVNRQGTIASVIHPNYLTEKLIDEVLAGKIPDVEQSEGWPDPAGAEEYFRSLVKPKK